MKGMYLPNETKINRLTFLQSGWMSPATLHYRILDFIINVDMNLMDTNMPTKKNTVFEF